MVLDISVELKFWIAVVGFLLMDLLFVFVLIVK